MAKELNFPNAEEIKDIIKGYLHKNKPLIYENGCLCYHITGVWNDPYGCYLRGYLYNANETITVASLVNYPTYDKIYNVMKGGQEE